MLMDHVGEGPPLARLLAAADAQGRTALHACALHGATRAAKMLVDAGADVDAVDGTGATPLHVAATGDCLCGNQNFTARSCCIVASSSTPSTRRLLDGVAMPVPRRSTKPGRPRRRREMT